MSEEEIDVEPELEPAPKKYRYSASRLKRWMQCPLQAHFYYNEKRPELLNAKTAFGSIMHRALEEYNKTANYERTVELFKDLWQNPEKIGAAPDVWPRFTSYAGLRQRGLEMLAVTHERMKWDTREVLATEHPFLIPFGKFELTGVVDLLETRLTGKGKRILAVVDWKTTTRPPWISDLALDLQFTIYLLAVDHLEFWVGNGPDFPAIPNGEWLYEVNKDLPRRAIWSHLWTAKEYDAGPRDAQDYKQLYRLCTEVAKAEEAEIYIPRIGEPCGLCSYQEPCGLTVPTKEELVEDENAWI